MRAIALPTLLGRMSAREAIRYLDAMRELALAVGGGAQVKGHCGPL